MSSSPLIAVDLFCGLGGLTAGLKDAGFLVAAASEIDPDARQTYAANHPEVALLGDVRTLTGANIKKTIRRRRIDLLVGCPPCQGFSRLTEKHRSRDPRNQLVLEFLRLARELRPRICMMENVPGLLTRGNALFNRLLAGLKRAGYQPEYEVLELADFGVPQFRKRLVLVAGRGFRVPIPPPTHPGPDHWVSVGQVISRLPPPQKRSELADKRHLPASMHFTRDLTTAVKKRLKYIASHGGSRVVLPRDLKLKCHRHKTTKRVGFTDVYGVFDLSQPAPTITGGCTNLSKGRFGHPKQLRPLTPREAAMVQTLGRSYKLKGTGVESIAVQIGNALPRRFARVAGQHVKQYLR